MPRLKKFKTISSSKSINEPLSRFHAIKKGGEEKENFVPRYSYRLCWRVLDLITEIISSANLKDDKLIE